MNERRLRYIAAASAFVIAGAVDRKGRARTIAFLDVASAPDCAYGQRGAGTGEL
jgi:hypothetical protein